jgi:peroxiredoxin
MLTIGDQIPSAKVARLEGDLPVAFDIRDLLKGHRTLIVGVPQAFTPVCSKQHIPGIVESLDGLRDSGLTQFVILAPDNPWAMAVWKEQFPGAEDFVFLSDGNGAFVETCGLKESCAGLFMGDCSKRYAIQTDGTTITSLSIEDSILVVKCSSAAAQLGGAEQIHAEEVFEVIEG